MSFVVPGDYEHWITFTWFGIRMALVTGCDCKSGRVSAVSVDYQRANNEGNVLERTCISDERWTSKSLQYAIVGSGVV
jgi:hypothetical protein